MIGAGRLLVGVLLLGATASFAACGSSDPGAGIGEAGDGRPQILAVETFLADITRNVAGDVVNVRSLVPVAADPHAFELTPADAVKVATCDVLVFNGAGFEPNMQQMLENIGDGAMVIEAAVGLASRTAREGEASDDHETPVDGETAAHGHDQGDPHFWLDPTLVVKYVENIRDGLSTFDPGHAAAFAANAAAYIDSLKELDSWIAEQVAAIPADRRLLVTNHESLGYYADRYGFTVVGTIMPSVSSGAAPSARQLAELIGTIRETGVRAIFLETGSNPDLAEQVAAETGITVVTQLYTHSLTAAGGAAPTYIDMMRANTEAIVTALK